MAAGLAIGDNGAGLRLVHVEHRHPFDFLGFALFSIAIGAFQLFLDRGADTNAREVMDRTALDWARESSNAEMAQLIRARTVK